MAKKYSSSRRNFLRQLGGSTVMLTAGSLSSLAAKEAEETRVINYQKKIGPNDKIRIAGIGMGIMGFSDIGSSVKVPGVELVAACDLYKGRLERVKEVYGKDIFTTQDYREILERKDIDAVVIATADLWHSRISIDAMNKGKHVYCEKPMVHKISQGLEVIDAHKRTNKTMQIGSQVVSDIAFLKAKELYKAGEIGQLACIEATTDRQSAIGAWEYTMPTDHSPSTVDWDRYIAGMPKQPYDPKKFFWWRNYRDFGTGVSGDLFIHLLTGIHFLTDSVGPEMICTSGQLSYWKDGRDVPDVMTGIMHYPETKEHPAFEVMLRVNFISGEGDVGSTKFIGSEGVIDMGWNGFQVRHHKMPKAPGIGGWDALTTYPKAMQDELMKNYNQKYSADDQKGGSKPPINYKVPDDFNGDVAHHTNFYDAIRAGKPVIEDPVFGFRAAGPCLAANESYFQKKIMYWDPVNMKLK